MTEDRRDTSNLKQQKDYVRDRHAKGKKKE